MTPWWEYVQKNINTFPKTMTPKEKFAIMSKRWREEKATLVTIPAQTITNLQEENAKFKRELEKANMIISQLEERLAFLEAMMVDDNLA